MYDVKPEVLSLLETIPEVNVVGEYPKEFAQLPLISFYELTNKESEPKLPGVLTEVSLQIDVWSKRSTGSLAQQVNTLLNSIGFRRQTARDISDPSGVNRKTMRYRGIIDARTKRVTQ
ncbi:hypothetical protein [Paenibacillus senegalimassiliensis]|uniref:hypothetical protein n=1 Tax=Paenibacillus senegalimassiliensis TaxID=1737426 RepID=UPI00073F76F6|nr:hypothetical protein [Paenibacillus senegalimassiliensis]